jgi:transcriptional regulator with XRE-family HTH domain
MINRFRKIMEQVQLTPSEFADRIGVQRSSVSHVLSGRNKPGLDFLEKILIAFPEIDAAWLVTGKTSQPNARRSEAKGICEFEKELQIEIKPELENIKIPIPNDEEAVDHIIIVYKNNTFRLLAPKNL